MSVPLPLSTLATRFARIIADLCFEVPKHIARDRTAGPLINLIYSHLRRLGAQFAAIAARAQAGTLHVAGQPGAATGCSGAEVYLLVMTDPEMAALIKGAPR